MDYKDVKPHLVYKLINAEKNKELLKDIPHMEYMDLAIVFKCMVFHEKLGDASILIRNAHMKLWGKVLETEETDIVTIVIEAKNRASADRAIMAMLKDAPNVKEFDGICIED